MLEEQMQELKDLPKRMTGVESQILQLRDEMRDECSAIRSEIRTGDQETRNLLAAEIKAGDQETRNLLVAEIKAGDQETRNFLIAEIRSGDQDTRNFMRALHEEARTIIATMGEGKKGRRR